MAGHKWLVTDMDPRRIRDIVLDVAEREGFDIDPLDRWCFKLTRGSKGASILVGALADYCELQVTVQKYDDVTSEVLLEAGSAWWTGVIGMVRVRDAARSLANRMKDRLEDRGAYVPREADF